MKTIYLKPTTEIVFVETQMICTISNTKVEDGLNRNEPKVTGEVSGNLSRRRTVWDDEEQEEQY